MKTTPLARALLLIATVVVPAAAQPIQSGPSQPPDGPVLLHPMFQDHAVLQRDRPIRLYGETAPGAAVTVTLGDRSAEVRAGADGRWLAILPAMPAGGPHTLTASSNGQVSQADDVLIGDVFFCTGQSNMAFAQQRAQGAADDARTATDGEIRQLTVANRASATPLETFATPVRWVVGSPETVGSFSASCYYFVRELKRTVDVPMGMVVAAWGGTRVRNWVSEPALRRLGLYDDDLDLLALSRTDEPAAQRRWGEAWEEWWKTARPQDGEPWRPEYDDASWPTAPRELGAWALWHGSSPDGFVGQMWMRTTVSLTAEQARKPGAVLDLGSVNEEDETWVNGETVGASSNASRTLHPLRPGLLREGVNIIATNIFCSWRSCGLRGPVENLAIRFDDGSSIPLANPWRYQEVPEGVIAPQLPWGPTHGVTVVYNGLVAPIGPFNFRAAVWYQGESDIYFADRYTATLLAMMQDWRRQFENPEMPFLIVQLPNYGPIPSRPTASVWSDVREAQRQAVQQDNHAALTVNVDIGDANDLHPTNKADIGRRLAIAARHAIYGEPIPPSGPTVASVTRRGNDVVVAFRDVNGQLVGRSGNPNAFELCGPDQASCRWADTRIEGDAVVLLQAGDATRVRYCWGDAPVCTLYDTSGLPAGPFEEMIRE